MAVKVEKLRKKLRVLSLKAQTSLRACSNLQVVHTIGKLIQLAITLPYKSELLNATLIYENFLDEVSAKKSELKQKQSSTTLPLKRAQNHYLRVISGPKAYGVSKEIVLPSI